MQKVSGEVGIPDLTDTAVGIFSVVVVILLMLPSVHPKKLELAFMFIQNAVLSLEDSKPLKGHLLTLKNVSLSESSRMDYLLV
uniref:Uncharacterized protein n=1 Tax=Oryzias latipes TaxID=8090 RepID=A0A3P9I1I4_ORYLA